VILAYDGKKRFQVVERYVDPLLRFQAAILEFDADDRAIVEIGPVGPSIYLGVRLAFDVASTVDENSFHFPLPGAGEHVEQTCGSGDFPYKAYAHECDFTCDVTEYWFDPNSDVDTVTWWINGVQLSPPPDYHGTSYTIPVSQTFALPAPFGTLPRASQVTVKVIPVWLGGLSVRTTASDGNYELTVRVAYRFKTGAEARTEARFEVRGQTLEIHGGWRDFIQACNIARLVWFSSVRERERIPIMHILPHADPVIPRNPGDPPPVWDATLQSLDWCAEHKPGDLEVALIGALKLHGFEFADALRGRPWSDALRWGRVDDPMPAGKAIS
jgi:hypothetical protein